MSTSREVATNGVLRMRGLGLVLIVIGVSLITAVVVGVVVRDSRNHWNAVRQGRKADRVYCLGQDIGGSGGLKLEDVRITATYSGFVAEKEGYTWSIGGQHACEIKWASE